MNIEKYKLKVLIKSRAFTLCASSTHWQKTPHCPYDYITRRMVILYRVAILTEWHRFNAKFVLKPSYRLVQVDL